jgi:CHC2 zinc finger
VRSGFLGKPETTGGEHNSSPFHLIELSVASSQQEATVTEATIDFKALKAVATIDRVVPLLRHTMTRRGDQFRSPCPKCQTGGDRALVVTVSEGKFYCFANKRGGDAIALVAHVEGMTQTDAATFIISRLGLDNSVDTNSRSGALSKPPEPTGKEADSPVFKAMSPLPYLDAHHEAVAALGISAETAEALGIGYASKGTMLRRVCVPIHMRDGMLVAYCGIATDETQQPRYLYPPNFDPVYGIWNQHRVSGDNLTVVRDLLAAILAIENGVNNVVAFLTEMISASQLVGLSSLMDERNIEAIEFA